MKKSSLPGIFLLSLLLPFQVFAFTDVNSSDPHEQAINFVYEQAIVNGYADGTYRSKIFINRAEFTKIVMAWLYKDKIAGSNCFPDIHTEWFSPYVCGAKALSVIQGYNDGFFRPNNNITLAEALKIIIEAQKITLANVGTSTPWYQKYWNYALQNPSLLQSIQQDPNHQITRGEMASLVYNMSQFNGSTSYQPMNDQQVNELKAIINQFSQGQSPLEKKQYLTQNFGNLLSNFLAMAIYGQDQQMSDSLSQIALVGLWSLPDTSIAKLHEAKISDQNAYLIYETATSEAYGLSCISFKNENSWKIDHTSASVTLDQTKKSLIQSSIEDSCRKLSPVTNLLTADDLHLAQQTFKSEYSYDIYLNGYLIKKGGIGGGLNTRGLPLKNGLNELKIVTGKSFKNILGSDPFSQLGQTINGLQYSLSVNEKELVSIQITEADKTVIKTFDCSL